MRYDTRGTDAPSPRPRPAEVSDADRLPRRPTPRRRLPVARPVGPGRRPPHPTPPARVPGHPLPRPGGPVGPAGVVARGPDRAGGGSPPQPPGGQDSPVV